MHIIHVAWGRSPVSGNLPTWKADDTIDSFQNKRSLDRLCMIWMNSMARKSSTEKRNEKRDDDQHCCDSEREPHAICNRRRTRGDQVSRRRTKREYQAHHGCAGDQPQIARQVEQTGDDASLLWSTICH